MKRPVVRTINLKDAKFVYASVCCNAVGQKPSCTMPQGKGIGQHLGAIPEGDATLGSWKCSNCKKPCKVTRTPNTQDAI
jgi:hypothetical protein